MKTHYFILFLSVCITTQLFSQINNPDTLFKKARYYSSQKEYDSAIKIIQLLIQEFPDNDDYKIFLGRVYSWQGNYNRSLEVLLPILNADSMNMSALEAIINAYLLAEKYLEVIHYCNIGLRKSNNDFLFFAFKKSFALEKMEKNKEALLLIDTILKNHSDCEEALALRTFIYQKKKRTLSLSYQNTSFTNPAFQAWHLVYLEYKQNIQKV
ncbi:MAG TPA: tetratricopeptide repeat protein, partial [Bacteroidia bacterium]|nr:tetratricopeptide repeat protein [Bacteroidia bacterium]